MPPSMPHLHHRAVPTVRSVPLVSNQSLSDRYFVLTFALSAPDASPGQFMMVHGDDWGLAPFLPRPMSILRAEPQLEILVKRVGEGTALLTSATSSDCFTLQLPLGHPWGTCPRDHTPVLVAGGVGIAPLLFLAETMSKSAWSARRPILLYGGRSDGDLPLADRARRVTELRVATEDGSVGFRGRVTGLLRKVLDEVSGPVKLYACGPHGMMAAVANMAAERAVLCEVSLEAVMGCGRGVCLGCAVPRRDEGYLYACVDGPCLDSRTIHWETKR